MTGSNGFIGSHLVEYLLVKQYEVTCLVRKTSDLRWIRDLDVDLIYGDCRQRESLDEAVKDHDYVFHLAGKIRARDWGAYYDANYTGTRNLVEACVDSNRGMKRFIYVSSISAAGPTDTAIVQTKEDECRPVSDYGKSKLMGEETVRERMTGIPWVIIRPPNILGPREEDLYSVFKIIRRRVKPLLGNGEKQTSICFVEDLVRGIEMAATSEKTVGNVYYLTDPEVYSWREMADKIAEYLGVSGLLLPVPYPVLFVVASLLEVAAVVTGGEPLMTRKQLRELKDSYWLYDGSRAEEDFGFTPKIDLNKGIEISIDWYREQGWL